MRTKMRNFLTALMLLIGLSAIGQTYNNEWIEPGKTYYKFKLADSGLYRIGQATLNAAGLANIPAEQFKLVRNGQEVPLTTSVASGLIPAGGFIEFFGEPNNGTPDKPLYRSAAFQHTEKVSLQTDTAVYFLVATEGVHLRYSEVANNVAANTLPAEPFFQHVIGNYFKETLNPGYARVIGEYVYSSSYDNGEFWSTQDIYPSTPRSFPYNNLFAFTGANSSASIRFGASGNANNKRFARFAINGTNVRETEMDYFADSVVQANFSPSILAGGTATVNVNNLSGVGTDRMVVSFFEINYSRTFNFGGSRQFYFQLAAKNQGYYLDISNFNFGTQRPVLFDLNSRERFTGEIAGSNIRFALPGSSTIRRLVLISQEAAVIRNVTSLVQKNFINFRTAANQGNYLIISNPLLYSGTNNINAVEQYRAYRSSAVGGGHTAKIYDIDELVDQFAFGIKKHPLSIRNFLRFARATFAQAPRNVFLIGRGVAYNEYARNQSDPIADRLNLVPSFGNPASDNMLSTADVTSTLPLTPIGRLSVVSSKELEDYLEKVKEYEGAQQTAANTLQDKLWMKNVIHVTGASDSYLGTVLCNYMEGYRRIIEDTTSGANVTVFCKSTTNPVEQLSNDRIAALFQEGLSLVTYFGHSSSTTLEFNLDNPQNYNNQGKYPVFSVNGCNAGNFFVFDPQRFTFNETLSEKFVLAKQRGGIAFIASTHFGIVNYLNIYIDAMYKDMASAKYRSTLGEINRDALQKMITASGESDYYARTHAEEITLHGDPALTMNFQALPDYVVEEPQVKVSPSFISIADNEFDLGIKLFNIGKAVKDSIVLEVKRQYPDGTMEILSRKKIRGIYYQDSIGLKVPIIATRDKGANKIIVTIDADLAVNEVSEANNTVTKEFYVYEDEAKPSFPYNYAIVTDPNQKLFASTANPFSTIKAYELEIDTTELFNSPLKVQRKISSVGGLLEFTPGVNFMDSTVYYWRVSLTPAAGSEYHWSNSSFIFLKNGTTGFNQSHYFQHQQSGLQNISLAENKKWTYGTIKNDIYVRGGTWVTSVTEENQVSVTLNGNVLGANACAFSSLVMTVFDPVTFKPWINVTDPNTGEGKYGSYRNNCYPGRLINFEYRYTDRESRRRLINFLDNVVPKGAYVLIRSFAVGPTTEIYGIPPYSNFPQAFVNDWKSDTTAFGSGNSLYHRLLQQGFSGIDSFNRPRNFIFMYKKDDPTYFAPKFAITQGIYDNVILAADCPSPDTIGYITSPVFGPAKKWSKVHWRGASEETNSADNPSVDVMGITNGGTAVKLYTLDKSSQDFDISAISAAQYPNVQLKMRNIDSVTLTPYQLRYWRLDYEPVAEGALQPNLFFTTKDSLEIGEPLNFGIAFKNISQANFDSLRIKMTVFDKNNVAHVVPLPKVKPLVVNDSVNIKFQLDTRSYSDLNMLYLDVNPDNDQPEQYHFNNFLYRNFYVKPDKVNPLLDVTFDGAHILNRDIVSARPHIQVRLKDEAKFLLLNDPALVTVQVRYPDPNRTVRTFKFDNDTLRFIPAANGGDNTASIEFNPAFLTQYDEAGDDYDLIITGKDRSGNQAGQTEYRVSFRVISKPMISNLMNYPNPFSTSTAFVFTLTGSEIPQNMKIQVLTVTGKIVREITKQELGQLHIGRNITEYKWDGNDQFGQRLANGVYLYRVVTTMNGLQMEKYKATGDDTDKYFKAGYGKMYLMR